jgi:hypothetical protein
MQLAVGAAEVSAGLVTLGLGSFGILFFVFGEFLVGVDGGITGGKHGIGASGLLLLFAQVAEFVAHLADGHFNGFHLDEEVTDFFEEVVEMVGADHVGEPGGFQRANKLAAGQFRNEVKDANATAFFDGNTGEFAESDEGRGIDAGQSDIGDDQRPFSGFQLGEEEVCVGNDADAPALGIEDLTHGGGALGVVFEDEDTHLTRFDRGRCRHYNRSIARRQIAKWPRTEAGSVSANG